MIFNRFFRSKHLDANPQVRIKAIDKLNHELAEEKSILHELAFNDPEASVSLAALQKLNSFTLWYKMSEIGKNERVLKKSQQVVEKMLFDQHDSTLSEKEKHSFVSQCKDHKLLEKLVFLPWVQTDKKLTLKLVSQLSKPSVVEKILLESPNQDLQLELLAGLEDEVSNHKLLAKLLKKNPSEQLEQKINTLLAQWHHLKQLPISVEKETRMVLSRLLALKDTNDYAHINNQYQMLSEQYQTLASQFYCLTEFKKQEFEQKWHELSERIIKLINGLKPDWQAKQLADKQNAAIEQLLIEGEQLLSGTTGLLKSKLLELSSQEIDDEGEKLNQLYDKIQSELSVLPAARENARKALLAIIGQIHACQETLSNLPAFMLCITQSQALIKQVSELPLPNDSSQLEAGELYLKEIKQQWRELTHRFHKNLPLELNQQWQQVVNEWQGALKHIRKQVDEELKRCRNKLRAIDGMITQGRFKLAMELFTKVVVWYQSLPEKQQAMLEKNFLQVKEQIENLKDWQEYIAAPRKPAILEEVERLIASPLAIEQQAQAVKVLRRQWNSLGLIDSESDQALNHAFDEAIEKAFAPCRAHYEQQQKMREQNLLEKQKLLSQLEALQTSNENNNVLAKTLRAVQQNWRNIGEVEFSLRKTTEDSFYQLVKPLKAKIGAFYQDNAEQKSQLITKAQKCLTLDSIDDAVAQIKQLQQTWKTIEHAGRKAEAELWPAFRQACDDVFARRQTLKEQSLSETKAQVSVLEEQIKSLETSLFEAKERAIFDEIMQEKTHLHTSLDSFPERERSRFARRLIKIEEHITEKLNSLETNQIKQVYESLFAALALSNDHSKQLELVQQLPNTWQQALQMVNPNGDRKALTITMEIVKEQTSPQTDQTQRQRIQMQLMAKKLQDGEIDSLDELLKQWIACGPIKANEQALLERAQKLFCS